MSYQILTRKNYDFYECASALQKSVRRGIEKDALFFGMELYGSGYSKYLWKRIFIMVSEDVGLANPDLPQRIQALYANWQIIAEKNVNDGTLPIIHAIVELCRSKKSRMLDHAKVWALFTDYRPEVPDYALDTHTRRGKRMGRNLDFFKEVGSVINDELDLQNDLDQFYKEKFEQTLDDWRDGKIDGTGYDPENIVHKNTKDMEKHKRESVNLFNQQ
jgi:replication-associated recombination protein RarA